eukprot:TRINITY_DN1802_c3_g1_i1.p1 TRINITY_DN1802_c3_g1~~TRINITY_DN1802_c3_g1_i1.p1  ORF type:complete len:217 (-),score=135.48 TRINITY_DN1802_c3_g1_i1:40-627(-)
MNGVESQVEIIQTIQVEVPMGKPLENSPFNLETESQDENQVENQVEDNKMEIVAAPKSNEISKKSPKKNKSKSTESQTPEKSVQVEKPVQVESPAQVETPKLSKAQKKRARKAAKSAEDSAKTPEKVSPTKETANPAVSPAVSAVKSTPTKNTPVDKGRPSLAVIPKIDLTMAKDTDGDDDFPDIIDEGPDSDDE